MKRLHGVISVLPTMFTPDGSDVDLDDLRAVIDQVIADGAHGVALLGVASEFYKLDDQERKRIIETTTAHTAGRVPVVVNITRHATELAVRDARHAEAAGADAVMVIPPSFIPPGRDAIIAHIQQVSDSVGIPVIIQYAPQVTGVAIAAETFLDMYRRQNKPMYIKAESIPPGPLVSSLLEQSDGQIGIFIGNGCVQMYDALERGAHGLMPGAAMVKPYVEIYNAWREGDKKRAFERFNDFLPVLNLTTQGNAAELFIKFEKRVLKARGVIKSDVCRKPDGTPDAAFIRQLQLYNDHMRERFGQPLFP